MGVEELVGTASAQGTDLDLNAEFVSGVRWLRKFESERYGGVAYVYVRFSLAQSERRPDSCNGCPNCLRT